MHRRASIKKRRVNPLPGESLSENLILEDDPYGRLEATLNLSLVVGRPSTDRPVLSIVASIAVLALLWAEMFDLIEMSERVGRVVLVAVFVLAVVALVRLVLLLT